MPLAAKYSCVYCPLEDADGAAVKPGDAETLSLLPMHMGATAAMLDRLLAADAAAAPGR